MHTLTAFKPEGNVPTRKGRVTISFRLERHSLNGVSLPAIGSLAFRDSNPSRHSEEFKFRMSPLQLPF